MLLLLCVCVTFCARKHAFTNSIKVDFRVCNKIRRRYFNAVCSFCHHFCDITSLLLLFFPRLQHKSIAFGVCVA